VGVRWPGHTTLGHRGPLASEPCRFSVFFKTFKNRNFEIQNGDLPDVQISPNFVGRLFET
jgi:hypothetical protein